MPKYKALATMYIDLYLEFDADDADCAWEWAKHAADEGLFLEEESSGGLDIIEVEEVT